MDDPAPLGLLTSDARSCWGSVRWSPVSHRGLCVYMNMYIYVYIIYIYIYTYVVYIYIYIHDFDQNIGSPKSNGLLSLFSHYNRDVWVIPSLLSQLFHILRLMFNTDLSDPMML